MGKLRDENRPKNPTALCVAPLRITRVSHTAYRQNEIGRTGGQQHRVQQILPQLTSINCKNNIDSVLLTAADY